MFIDNEGESRQDVIERQLVHYGRNKIRAISYNHAQFPPERRDMIDWRSGYVDGAVATEKRSR
jgi:hypothetical protein